MNPPSDPAAVEASALETLQRLLESLAAKRAARVEVAAPLVANVKQWQTLHDAAVFPIDSEIADLEERAKKLADEHRATIFAKAPTFKHADSVLKLTTSTAIECDLEESEVIQNLLEAAELERDAFKTRVAALLEVAMQKIEAAGFAGALHDVICGLEAARQMVNAKPDASTMGPAVCITTKHSLNKKVIGGLWTAFGHVLQTFGLARRQTKQVSLSEA